MRRKPTTDQAHLLGFWEYLHGAEGDDDGDAGPEGDDSAGSVGPEGSDGGNDEGDEGGDDEAGEDVSISLREARKLRRENAALRAAKKDAEEKLSEREKAELSKAERAELEAQEARDRATTLEAELEQERFTRVLVSAAASEKFNDPEDALAYISLDDVKRNDDGSYNKASLNAAVKALAKDKPYLIATTGSGSGDGGSRGNAPPVDDDKKRQAEDSILKKGGVKIR